MHNKYKKSQSAPKASDRLRRQIAVEAAKRMIDHFNNPAPDSHAAGSSLVDSNGHLQDLGADQYYAFKRKAVAVLGHRVRPGDLPSDSEVREQILALIKASSEQDLDLPEDDDSQANPRDPEPETKTDPNTKTEDVPAPLNMADHLDRFTIYRMRLTPLESIKLDPRSHPEGDALYHSLQVFDKARDTRPYDEEFLLAALLHEVGQAIDPRSATDAAIEVLRGTITRRTEWLVRHLADAQGYLDRSLSPVRRQELLDQPQWLEDLLVLLELDRAGRVPGLETPTIDEALEIIQRLERENDHQDELTSPPNLLNFPNQG